MGDPPHGAAAVPAIRRRRRAYVALDIDTAQRILATAVGPCRITSLKQLTAGMLNTNYRIAAEGLVSELVLRIHTNEPEACQIEADALRLVHERVPVPVMMHADCAGALTGWPYSVRTWVEGVTLREVLASGTPRDAAEAGTAVGNVLARIGTFTFAAPGLFGPGLAIATAFPGIRASVTTFVEDSLDHRASGRRLGGRGAALRATLRRHAYLLDPLETRYSLVHGDFSPDNIILDRAAAYWQVKGVLDWEFASSGSPLFDLAVLLRERERVSEAFTARLLAAYGEAGGSLPPDWQRIIRVLDLVNLCDLLDDPEDIPELVERVTARVDETIRELDAPTTATRFPGGASNDVS